MTGEDDFALLMKALDERLAEVERSCPPTALELVRALVRAVLDVHQSGLREILAVLTASEHVDAKPLLRTLCARPSVASLLLMHELHPDDFSDRIERALTEANDNATGQARAALVAIEGRRVLMRIEGGPPAAALLLRRLLERVSCEHAPDALVQIEGGEPITDAREMPNHESALVPVSRLHAHAAELRK